MKKILIVFSIFVLSSMLLTSGFYNSNSLPGFGGSESCNYCHNQPTFVKEVPISFAMNDFIGANNLFTQYAQHSTDEVPTV